MRRDEKSVVSRPVRSLLDDFLQNAFFDTDNEDAKLMAMDVIERDNEFVMSANLPGIKKNDIRVYVEGNNLVIEAKHDKKSEEKNGTMYRCERYHGDYRRVFALPENWDFEKIEAKHENGVLNLTIPKKERKPEKEITIS
jgi:HSP20 family protein